ncbi:MAG: helix-turn-helix transcriptional regulator [Mycobacterium sp.]
MSSLELALVTEDITTPTDWSWREPHHVVVVHRRGRMRTMEFEIEHGPSGHALPNIGDVWVIPAEHHYAALAHGDTVQYCQLSIPANAVPGDAVEPTIGQRDPLTYQLVERIDTMMGRDDVFARLLTDSLTDTLLCHLTGRLTVGAAPQAPHYRELPKPMQIALIEYLDDSADDQIGLAQLAECGGMSVSEFVRAFAATFHTTPYQFFTSRRISKAKQLLARSSLSIDEIGAAIGFLNVSHFTTTFEDHVGATPHAYRSYA